MPKTVKNFTVKLSKEEVDGAEQVWASYVEILVWKEMKERGFTTDQCLLSNPFTKLEWFETEDGELECAITAIEVDVEVEV